MLASRVTQEVTGSRVHSRGDGGDSGSLPALRGDRVDRHVEHRAGGPGSWSRAAGAQRWFLLLPCCRRAGALSRLGDSFPRVSLTPCFPSRDQNHVYLGDKNSLNLTFHAQNVGEGGAYEAELRVTAPPEAEYSGLVRNPGVRGGSGAWPGTGPAAGHPNLTLPAPPPAPPPELLQPEL